MPGTAKQRASGARLGPRVVDQALLAFPGQGPRGVLRPGTSSPALCPSPPSATSRVPSPRNPSKPPETVTPGVYGLHQSATHGSQTKGSLDLASHIPKGERRVAAPFQLGWDSLLSQLRRLRCPGRCRTRGWQPGGIRPDPSPSPNFCVSLRRSSNLCSSAPPTWLPPPLWSGLRNPSLPPARRPPGPGILPPTPPRAAAAARVPLPPLGRSLPSP